MKLGEENMQGISVIMSTYNENVDDLEKAIESILSQSYRKFEFIIVLDNPSNTELYNCIKKIQ